MTMRQVAGLLVVIARADLVEFYSDLLSYGTIHGAKLPSLNEFLDLSLNKESTKESSFDEKTDKVLEAQALKLLEERRAKHGQ